MKRALIFALCTILLIVAGSVVFAGYFPTTAGYALGLLFGGSPIPLSSTPPTSGQVLEYNGSQIVGVTGGTAYPAVDELGTIASGGTATCAFASTPVCHFTVPAGSANFTIANPSSDPPTIGSTVTVVWKQAGSGFPGTLWDTKWYYNDGNDVVPLSSHQAFDLYLSFTFSPLGASALTFEWDGTEYVLNTPNSIKLNSVEVVGGVNFGTASVQDFHFAGQPGSAFLQPTLDSGFGTSPSENTAVGTNTFTINVGTGGTASSGVIGFGALHATNGWDCKCTDITTTSSTVFMTKQKTPVSTSQCTIANFNSSGASAAWASGDNLSCTAWGY